MKWFKKIRQKIRGMSVAHRFFYHPYLAIKYHLPSDYRLEWLKRIDDVLKSPELKLIKKVPNAGTITNGYQIMHNGIKIVKDSYYAYPITKMLTLSKGVHEPQEEYAFKEVLKSVSKNGTMLELGAYWGFYSMWFNKEIKNAHNYLIEPEPVNLRYGMKNFDLNKMKGSFYQGYIGKKNDLAEDGINILSIDEFTASQNIKFVDLLHADIQGFEIDMLKGAKRMLKEKLIGFIFISSHSQKLHNNCLKILRDAHYKIVTEISPEESYSVDGLIVAKKPKFPGPDKIKLSKMVPNTNHTRLRT